jgi:hypothetical protein
MPAGLLRLRKPSVVIRKFGNGFCNGCNGYNGCQQEGRRKKEEGSSATDSLSEDVTDVRKKEEGRRKKEEGRGKKEEGRRKKEEGRRKKEECNGQCMGFNLYKEAGKRKIKSFEIALFGNAKANVTHKGKAVFS